MAFDLLKSQFASQYHSAWADDVSQQRLDVKRSYVSCGSHHGTERDDGYVRYQTTERMGL